MGHSVELKFGLPHAGVNSVFSLLAQISHVPRETTPQSGSKGAPCRPAWKGSQEGPVSRTLCQGQLSWFPKSNVFCLTSNGILLPWSMGSPIRNSGLEWWFTPALSCLTVALCMDGPKTMLALMSFEENRAPPVGSLQFPFSVFAKYAAFLHRVISKQGKVSSFSFS